MISCGNIKLEMGEEEEYMDYTQIKTEQYGWQENIKMDPTECIDLDLRYAIVNQDQNVAAVKDEVPPPEFETCMVKSELQILDTSYCETVPDNPANSYSADMSVVENKRTNGNVYSCEEDEQSFSGTRKLIRSIMMFCSNVKLESEDEQGMEYSPFKNDHDDWLENIRSISVPHCAMIKLDSTENEPPGVEYTVLKTKSEIADISTCTAERLIPEHQYSSNSGAVETSVPEREWTNNNPGPCEDDEQSFLGAATGTESQNDYLQYSCNQCQNSFANKASLKRHVNTHIDYKPYSCDQCDKSFTRKSTLKSHMYLHIDYKPYTCVLCSKSFAWKPNFERHMNTHADFSSEDNTDSKKPSVENINKIKTHYKSYLCTECDKSFIRKKNFEKHMNLHTGYKPYTCNICEKSFIEKANLKLHKSIHCGYKPYTCTRCRKSFAWERNLHRHVKINSCKKPYTCTKCMKPFPNKSLLLNHECVHPR